MASISVPTSSSSLLPLRRTLDLLPSPPSLPPRLAFLPKPFRRPRLLSSSTSSSSRSLFAGDGSASSASSAIPIAEIVEKDWSFLDATDSGDSERDARARRIIAAADIRPESKVLAALPTAGFVDRLAESAPCELLVAVHQSLFVLAMIKEGHDRVRCFQGGVEAVPRKFSPFDAAFVCYFPGMGVSVDELLASLAGLCRPGARLVIGFDQGREVIEKNHRQQHPDMVKSELPDRISLEKAAAKCSYQITEFVDEANVYLAVLRLLD